MLNTKSRYSEPLEFILLVGRSLHRYGAAAHHIEAALFGLAQKYCDEYEFFVTPTAIISSVKIDGEWQSRLQRVTPGGIDLGKLSLVDDVGDKVTHGVMNMQAGIEQIRKINRIPEGRFDPLIRILFFMVASLGFGGFLVFDWLDLAVVGVLGFVAAIMGEIIALIPNISQVKEFLISFVVSFLALLLISVFPDLTVNRIILSSLIVLIPGLSLTIALSEIATNNWLAGTARLMGAAAELLKISFGVVVGGLAAKGIHNIPVSSIEGQPDFLVPEIFLLLLSGLSFSYLFRNLRRDYIWVIIGACLGYYSSQLGAYIFGRELGVFWGGACLAAFSNGFARYLHRPALTVLIPGLIPMVPGSIGFQSLTFMFEHDVMATMASTFNLVIVAVALVAGLTVGNMIVHPRRSL
ncbi:threonine/serine ThrE exporter family protein [Pseudobacteriovorax antillogorgiicola]|uniref:Uncharacterized membrane protein YjjP, DUF1212 family n=1 Tax=Pseudobacteriovorax antillogorgiicola TaxID=1513793 RepID=A0A1Y6CJK3_9BACT|nr:threonine/serine exporter family protein [Pseudobacteriovorax antillogorgiicola]TCS46408.1 uncharacterized membrane protein YjjP (DUF1212 family) [Pseudobacteriovorax antillogorgiicola]SMF68875.1 Uncharacterized membrane protein YjjP, DUF1212 family [Pseudobacteriovorax antillogorgiicola]